MAVARVLGCVCLFARSACTPPILAGVCGACLPLRVSASARQSWLGLVVCVFGFGFCFQPAIPGWGVGVCVFLCALRACSPPVLAGVWVFRYGFGFDPGNHGSDL